MWSRTERHLVTFLCFSGNPFKGLFRCAPLSKEGRRARHLLRLFGDLIGATVEKVQDVKKAVVNLRSVGFLFSSELIERVVTFGLRERTFAERNPLGFKALLKLEERCCVAL